MVNVDREAQSALIPEHVLDGCTVSHGVFGTILFEIELLLLLPTAMG